jgi:hypothetical protein
LPILSATKPKALSPLAVSTPRTEILLITAAATWLSTNVLVTPVTPLTVSDLIVCTVSKSVRESGRSSVPAKMLELIKPPTFTLPMSPCEWMVELFTNPATVILDSLADVKVSRLASKSPRTPVFLVACDLQ